MGPSPERYREVSYSVIVSVFLTLLDYLAKRVITPRNAWNQLAVLSLTIAGTALAPPILQVFAVNVLNRAGFDDGSYLPSTIVGALFLLLASIFGWFSAKLTRQMATDEHLVSTPEIREVGYIGSVRLSSYCGSVMHLNDVNLVVTSEDQDLLLGSPSGTSVSGRMRRLSTETSRDGQTKHDWIEDQLNDWKTSSAKAVGPYELGTHLFVESHSPARYKIDELMLAVALSKSDSGRNSIDEVAIARIIDAALSRCETKGHKTLFIPVFGLGSGGLDPDEALTATLSPLAKAAATYSMGLTVYVGTYRLSNGLRCQIKLARMTSSNWFARRRKSGRVEV